MKWTAAIPVAVLVCLVAHAHAGQPNAQAQKPAHPPAARPQAPRPNAPRPSAAAPKAANPDGGPASPVALEKLLKLTPEQRNKALGLLPPARRAQIEKKLEEYQKIPPQQRARELERFQRMHSLPPQKQQQVRASLQKLAALDEPRRKLVQRQLNQMRNLSDADRSALINSEEFRSKFTPAEQQIVEDVSLITPRN